VLVYLNFKFIPDLNAKPREWFNLDLDLSELSAAIYGFLLVIMMVLRPQGLIPERRRKLELVEHVGVGQTTGIGEAGGDTFEARA
jgi:branched-chain amino acid transport system permease protein